MSVQAKQADVMANKQLLLALIPPLGPKAQLYPLLAFLKLAPNHHLQINRSELHIRNANDQLISTKVDAFGLNPGMNITGPYSNNLTEDYRFLPDAHLVQWLLNDYLLEAQVWIQKEYWRLPRLVALPLLLPLKNDPQLIVTVVNLGNESINIAKGIQEAICWLDDEAYYSSAGGLWNGPYLIRPNHSYTARFRLDDFPGLLPNEQHNISIDILGLSSPKQTIQFISPD